MTPLANAAASGIVCSSLPHTFTPGVFAYCWAIARAEMLNPSSNAPIAQPNVSMRRRLHSCTAAAGSAANSACIAKSTSFLVLASIVLFAVRDSGSAFEHNRRQCVLVDHHVDNRRLAARERALNSALQFSRFRDVLAMRAEHFRQCAEIRILV